jgi:hypothetical protein
VGQSPTRIFISLSLSIDALGGASDPADESSGLIRQKPSEALKHSKCFPLSARVENAPYVRGDSVIRELVSLMLLSCIKWYKALQPT